MMTFFEWSLIIITGIYALWGLFFFAGLFRRNRKLTTDKPFVSVIIAARNEEQHITETLNCLTSQSYPPELYEVILVDDQSEDATARIGEDFQKRHSNFRTFTIQEIPHNFSPKKFALQEGIQRSKGAIILTTDADCRVPRTWIEGMTSHFTPEAGMVAGASVIRTETSSHSLLAGIQAVDFIALLSASAGSIKMGLPLAVSGQNLAYRRAAFEEVGGFSKISHHISGDDVLLLQLIKQRTEWKIRFADPTKTAVSTTPLTSYAGFVKQRIRWASNSDAQRHLDPLFFLYLLSVFFLCSGLIILVPLSCLYPAARILLPVSLAIKFAVDLLVVTCGTFFFRAPIAYLSYFVPWFLAQPFLLVVAGIGGLHGKLTWKGRTFNRTTPAVGK